MIGDRPWVFEARMKHQSDPRFEGTLKAVDMAPVNFTLIRLSTRRWLISGEGVPQQVREGAALVGSIFERYLQEEIAV